MLTDQMSDKNRVTCNKDYFEDKIDEYTKDKYLFPILNSLEFPWNRFHSSECNLKYKKGKFLDCWIVCSNLAFLHIDYWLLSKIRPCTKDKLKLKVGTLYKLSHRLAYKARYLVYSFAYKRYSRLHYWRSNIHLAFLSMSFRKCSTLGRIADTYMRLLND